MNIWQLLLPKFWILTHLWNLIKCLYQAVHMLEIHYFIEYRVEWNVFSVGKTYYENKLFCRLSMIQDSNLVIFRQQNFFFLIFYKFHRKMYINSHDMHLTHSLCALCSFSLNPSWKTSSVTIRSYYLTETPMEYGLKRSHLDIQILYSCRKIYRQQNFSL